MTIKSPEEVAPRVREAVSLLIGRVSGAYMRELTYEQVFTSAERDWIDANVSSDEWDSLGGVALMQKVRGLSFERAVLDVSLELGHVSREKYDRLLRVIGVDDDVLDYDRQKATAHCELVLTDCPRTVYWMGEEVDMDFGKGEKAWQYLWKVARAARSCGFISYKDFDPIPQERTLNQWKHLLIKDRSFPDDLGKKIASKGGEHRLDLQPKQIRIFERRMDVGYREIRS